MTNYKAQNIEPQDITWKQMKELYSDIKAYLWDDSYFFKKGHTRLIRRCVHGSEAQII